MLQFYIKYIKPKIISFVIDRIIKFLARKKFKAINESDELFPWRVARLRFVLSTEKFTLFVNSKRNNGGQKV